MAIMVIIRIGINRESIWNSILLVPHGLALILIGCTCHFKKRFHQWQCTSLEIIREEKGLCLGRFRGSFLSAKKAMPNANGLRVRLRQGKSNRGRKENSCRVIPPGGTRQDQDVGPRPGRGRPRRWNGGRGGEMGGAREPVGLLIPGGRALWPRPGLLAPSKVRCWRQHHYHLQVEKDQVK